MRPLGWYARRLRRFERGELWWRVTDALGRAWWLRRAAGRPTPARPRAASGVALLAGDVRDHLDPRAVARLVQAADDLLAGRWEVLGIERTDLVAPAWDGDGLPADTTSIDLDGTRVPGPSLKHTWELSRHHVLTVLGAATWVTGERRYAERAALLLDSWIETHPQPRGNVHWASVEIAERLISWAWLRRLAGDVDAVRAAFDRDSTRRVIAQQFDWLLRFPSRYSSANNHRLAEAAGAVVGGFAFADLVPTARSARVALGRLHETLDAQVSPSGLQREPAVDYHCFVLDLAVVALAEAAAHGHAPPASTVERVTMMADALALVTAEDGVSAPRFGDSDESQVAQLDGPGTSAVERTLSLAAATVGASGAWPTVQATVRAVAVAAVAGGALSRRGDGMTSDVQRLARDGYVALLRSAPDVQPRVEVAMRVGPFAYRSIGSHSHADLLALDVRLGGRVLVADPATSAYGELPAWRREERSTRSHSTLRIGGLDQVEYWGPFLWGGDASATIVDCRRDPDDAERILGWTARHDAYARRGVAGEVARSVDLTAVALVVRDRVAPSVGAPARVEVELCWRLGPEWTTSGLRGSGLELRARVGAAVDVVVSLPDALQWSLGDDAGAGDAIAAGFGRRVASLTLRGVGAPVPGDELVTRFEWQTVS